MIALFITRNGNMASLALALVLTNYDVAPYAPSMVKRRFLVRCLV